jgi:hypothetical protein
MGSGRPVFGEVASLALICLMPTASAPSQPTSHRQCAEKMHYYSNKLLHFHSEILRITCLNQTSDIPRKIAFCQLKAQ